MPPERQRSVPGEHHLNLRMSISGMIIFQQQIVPSEDIELYQVHSGVEASRLSLTICGIMWIMRGEVDRQR